MKKDNISSSAGTTDESSTNVQDSQVSQPIAKPNVVGSLLGQREIKFRAWDKRLKKFHYESNILHVAGNKIFYDCGISGWQISNAHCEFSQFTGLKDKNGKEIYEDDIIRCDIYERESLTHGFDDEPIVVSFSDAGFYPLSKASQWRSGCENIVIIGNVFETTELLETLR